MTCPCGGWGVQDVESYRVGPCPECPTYVQLCHALHDRYDAVLREPVPEEFAELLAKLK